MLTRYAWQAWEETINKVKEAVKSFTDANLDTERERARNTWECYADCSWQRADWASLYEADIIHPMCQHVVRELPEFEVTCLLALKWDDYLNGVDPGVDRPWEMLLDDRRDAVSDLLIESVRCAAVSDGAEIEERLMFGDA